MVKISKYPVFVDYLLVFTCAINAVLTVFIIVFPEWTFINMMLTEASILNGHHFGPFRRCFSRFGIGEEFTCDDYIQPFWTLHPSMLFVRTGLIVAAITIIISVLTTMLSMSCVYPNQLPETSKTWLRLLTIVLRLVSGVFILLCVSLYATMIIHQDLRMAQVQSLAPNTQAFRYEVYNLWGRCIWIGWAVSCSEILLNLMTIYLWINPVKQAKNIKQKEKLRKMKKLKERERQEQLEQHYAQQYYPQPNIEQAYYLEPIPETIPEIDYDLLNRNNSNHSSTIMQC